MENDLNYQLGTVREITEELRLPNQEADLYVQQVRIEVDGSGQMAIVDVGNEFQPLTAAQRLETGTQVVMAQTPDSDGQAQYIVADIYRLPTLGILAIGFAILVAAVAKWRGILSLVGMGISFLVLIYFIVPQILQGSDPVVISLVGSAMISAVTMYLSHGWTLKSHIALISLLASLAAVTVLSWVSVHTAQLVGLGSEEAAFLQFGTTANINLQGLLLAGIILGALGVLDDIVVSQVSVVAQLLSLNSKLTFDELYSRALEVGKDHVASLVNTLVLAYAGANLPLFLLFYLNQDTPLWINLNNELIAEEIIRTLVGSMGLVLAVPLTSIAAAYLLLKYQKRGGKIKDLHIDHHAH